MKTTTPRPARRARLAAFLSAFLVLSVLAPAPVSAASPGGGAVAAVGAPPLPFHASSGGFERLGVGLVDPSQGIWNLYSADGDVKQFFYGNPGDFPIMGDWNCDGVDTPGLYRQSDGFVYLRNSNTSGVGDIRFFFGNPGDVPLAGDFNDDGCDTVSIYRPSEQIIYVINELGEDEKGLGAAERQYQFGNPGDKPFVGDFDGDGVDTVGLHRESTGLVYFRNSQTSGIADSQFIYGDPGDRLVAGDWNADGKDSPAIFRPSLSKYFFRFTNTQGNANDEFLFGRSNWLPVAGHFGPLNSGVNVDLGAAPEGLERAVEALYLWAPAAPAIPAGLSSHLDSIGPYGSSRTVSGKATVRKVRGQDAAVVTAGSDVVLAVKDPLRWRVVGARLNSFSKPAWYGGAPRLVLVLGADNTASGDPTSRNADSAHILAAAPASGQGAIVGLPRDTWVTAPYGIDKLAITMRDQGNGIAFGPATTLAAVRTETGLPIEGYLLTGFSRFTSMVDLFGGVVADLFYKVPQTPNSSGLCANEQYGPGPTNLGGAEALCVSRERVTMPSGDVDRSLTQGEIMLGAFAKVKSGGYHSVPGYLDLLDDYVITNLSAEALLTLGATAVGMSTPPNVVVEGLGGTRTSAKTGQPLFGWVLQTVNRTTFTDLGDGVLNSGRCTVDTNPPSGGVACWKRP